MARIVSGEMSPSNLSEPPGWLLFDTASTMEEIGTVEWHHAPPCRSHAVTVIEIEEYGGTVACSSTATPELGRGVTEGVSSGAAVGAAICVAVDSSAGALVGAFGGAGVRVGLHAAAKASKDTARRGTLWLKFINKSSGWLGL
jgi:hypothetical protein